MHIAFHLSYSGITCLQLTETHRSYFRWKMKRTRTGGGSNIGKIQAFFMKYKAHQETWRTNHRIGHHKGTCPPPGGDEHCNLNFLLHTSLGRQAWLPSHAYGHTGLHHFVFSVQRCQVVTQSQRGKSVWLVPLIPIQPATG